LGTDNRLEAKLDRIAEMVASPVKHEQSPDDARAAEENDFRPQHNGAAPTPRRLVPAPEERRQVAQTRFPVPQNEANSGKRYELGRALVTDLLVKAHGGTLEDLKELTDADLTGHQLESLYGLSDACPELKKLIVDENAITFLTGIPWTIMHLSLCRNRLSNLTSFRQLRDLRVLDVSHNNLQDLSGIASLLHLVDLRADENQITTLSGMHSLDSLVRCSVRNNRVSEITFMEASKFPSLEVLDVSGNRLESLSGVGGFASLQTLIAGEFFESRKSSAISQLDACCFSRPQPNRRD
jgi:Leucine-rich repeat (LRR) protein